MRNFRRFYSEFQLSLTIKSTVIFFAIGISSGQFVKQKFEAKIEEIQMQTTDDLTNIPQRRIGTESLKDVNNNNQKGNHFNKDSRSDIEQNQIQIQNRENDLNYPQKRQPINFETSAQAVQMQQPNPDVYIDPYAEMQINQGIAQGFGPFFFNARIPEIAKTNIPIKKESSMHIPVFVATIIMIGGIIAGAIIVKSPKTFGGGVALLIVPYFIYIIISFCLSDIRGYITNLKRFEEYKITYDKMVQGRGYFTFWIQCYHYKTVQTKNGTRRQKVVTHTATQTFHPTSSIDESGNITGILDLKKYIFINYLKRFYFADSRSQSVFQRSYNQFISKNRRDTHQTHTHTFEIEGLEPQVGFCQIGASAHNSMLFYLFTFLGLGFFYSFILERSISRYEINILKRLACA